MRKMDRKDTIWSVTLIVIAVLGLVLSVIPGMLQVYSKEMKNYVGCGLLNVPGGTVMENMMPMLLALYGYTVLLTVLYYRSQGLGTLKGIMIFGIADTLLSLMGLLPKIDAETVLLKPLPFLVIPCLFAVLTVLSIIRLRKEEARYDFD